MQIFLFSASVDSTRLNDLESRIRAELPNVRIVSRMEEVTKALPKAAGSDGELACILFPVVLVYQGWSFHVFRGRVGGTLASADGPPPAAASSIS